jgi:hypothetical protein
MLTAKSMEEGCGLGKSIVCYLWLCVRIWGACSGAHPQISKLQVTFRADVPASMRRALDQILAVRSPDQVREGFVSEPG